MSIDVNKILKWINLIENEDGDNLSLGSIRTLGMIKKELQGGSTPKPTMTFNDYIRTSLEDQEKQ